ncbi:MAG: hypothetical protein OEV42_08260 [Deltaproteobacteria bacterium]|nr:hypothetical protein [Deltaproteobacteria bacterium]
MQNLKVKFGFYSISKTLVMLSLSWCIFTGIYLWATPITSSETVKFSEISRFGIIPLVIPVSIALVAVWAIYTYSNTVLFMATILLGVFWLLSGFSIGLCYTPALILLGCASITSLVETLLTRRKNAQ